MIESLSKMISESTEKTKEVSSQGKNFDPDRRIEPGKKSSDDIKKEAYNPDKRITDIKPNPDGFYTTFEQRVKYTNLDKSEGGLRSTWDGERGNSLCRPVYDYMKRLLESKGLSGIDYKNGEADFSKVAEATVQIDNMTEIRPGDGGNYDQANIKLAEQFNKTKKDGRTDWTARDVDNYRKENNLTWHERCDCKTMDLIPTKIHEYFKHSGGVAECKARDRIGGAFDA